MPDKPRKNESQDSYMERCVDALKKEGKTPKKARDICYAVWLQNTSRNKVRKTKS